MFYGGELIPKVSEDIASRFLGWRELAGRNFPIIFHAVRGKSK
jgi:hypothetical protein